MGSVLNSTWAWFNPSTGMAMMYLLRPHWQPPRSGRSEAMMQAGRSCLGWQKEAKRWSSEEQGHTILARRGIVLALFCLAKFSR